MVEVGIEKEKILAIIIFLLIAIAFLFVIGKESGITCTILKGIVSFFPRTQAFAQLLGEGTLCEALQP